jgi:hypothetical protein
MNQPLNLLNNDMDFMLSQVAQCSSFNPTCDAQMRTGIYLLNAVCLKYDMTLTRCISITEPFRSNMRYAILWE